MIIFHEGLPGSGKSYEAVVRRVIPALAEGRCVDAYIEGLDHEKLAGLAGIPVERCRELLVVWSRDQVPSVASLSRDNALVVLDEAQNFWGTGGKLPPDITQFVTEHRHRGIDVVLMGQSIKDVHALWRRRVELKLVFLKLSGLGSDGRYSVATWRHKGNDKYEKVSTNVAKYESRYFGSYSSHVSDDTNTKTYRDSRATVWGSKVFVFWIPLAFVAAAWGAWYVWHYFHPAAAPSTSPPKSFSSSSPVAAPGYPAPVPLAASAPPIPPSKDLRKPAIERYLFSLDGNRMRLAGIARMGDRVAGVVEWVSGDMRVVDRMSLDTLRSLGVAVLVSGDTVQLASGEWSGFATPWPIEGDLRVSQARLDEVRGSPISGQVVTASGGGFTQTPDYPGPINLTPPRGAVSGSP